MKHNKGVYVWRTVPQNELFERLVGNERYSFIDVESVESGLRNASLNCLVAASQKLCMTRRLIYASLFDRQELASCLSFLLQL